MDISNLKEKANDLGVMDDNYVFIGPELNKAIRLYGSRERFRDDYAADENDKTILTMAKGTIDKAISTPAKTSADITNRILMRLEVFGVFSMLNKKRDSRTVKNGGDRIPPSKKKPTALPHWVSDHAWYEHHYTMRSGVMIPSLSYLQIFANGDCHLEILDPKIPQEDGSLSGLQYTGKATRESDTLLLFLESTSAAIEETMILRYSYEPLAPPPETLHGNWDGLDYSFTPRNGKSLLTKVDQLPQPLLESIRPSPSILYNKSQISAPESIVGTWHGCHITTDKNRSNTLVRSIIKIDSDGGCTLKYRRRGLTRDYSGYLIGDRANVLTFSLKHNDQHGDERVVWQVSYDTVYRRPVHGGCWIGIDFHDKKKVGYILLSDQELNKKEAVSKLSGYKYFSLPSAPDVDMREEFDWTEIWKNIRRQDPGTRIRILTSFVADWETVLGKIENLNKIKQLKWEFLLINPEAEETLEAIS